MPPHLALILVIGFISILLYIEVKWSGETGLAIWIISLWLLYSGSKGLGVFFKINTTIEAGSIPDRYFLLGLGVFGILILLKRRFQWQLTFKKNWLFMLILAYMLLSVTWSSVPGISFRRWGREFIVLIVACLLLSETNPLKAFFSTFRKVIYIYLPLSLVLIKYFPAFGREYNRWTGELMWVGMASQKNGLALFCAFSAIFLIWSLWKGLGNRGLLESKLPLLVDASMLVLAIYLMTGPKRTINYSVTSFLSLLTGLIAVLIVKQTTKKQLRLGKGVIAVVLLIILIGTFMPLSGKIQVKGLAQILGRSETLTGRTDIWNSLLPYAKKHMILGYGYGGFWTTYLRETIASNAHNGYLDTILTMGLIGLILFSCFLIKFVSVSSKLIDNEWNSAIFFLGIIFMYLVHNIGETLLGEFQSLPSALILLMSFLINEGHLQNNKEEISVT
ncbi:MAG: O-antigen ligase family protein [Candidatus Aminicenantales bacterium]